MAKSESSPTGSGTIAEGLRAIGRSDVGKMPRQPDRKWPKGNELAERVAVAACTGKIKQRDLYHLLIALQGKNSEAEMRLLASEGIDLRDDVFAFGATGAGKGAK